MVKLVVQPNDSNFCGHACLAMIAGLTIENILNEAGMPRGLTKTKHIRSGLLKYGFALGERLAGKPTDGKKAICRIKWPDNGSHWIIHASSGDIYDPIFGLNPEIHWPVGSRITSHYLIR